MQFTSRGGRNYDVWIMQNFCQSLAPEFFPPTPTTNLSNLLIEASIYCYLYALNEELKDYPKLLSDF
jgi:hypothetical protein